MKTTKELLHQLQSVTNKSRLKEYTDELFSHQNYTSFHEYILDKINEKQENTADIIKHSLIQRNYAYQILNGSKQPGKDKIIALCLSLSLSLEETQRALTLADIGQLYAKNRRDSILIFAIQNHLSVMDTNVLLDEMKESPLK